MNKINPMSRTALLSGALQLKLRAEGGVHATWSADAIERSLAETLALVEGDEIWVFAYGSLLWNPIFPVAEARRATIHGYHRAFCLNLPLGRGTPERPGLMLGLDRGGACTGLALKVGGKLELELALLWQREMLPGFYTPKWVRARTAEGDVKALAFVANPKSPHYRGRLDEAETARVIAGASGVLGSNAEYLARTVESLRAIGVRDRRTRRVWGMVGE